LAHNKHVAAKKKLNLIVLFALYDFSRVWRAAVLDLASLSLALGGPGAVTGLGGDAGYQGLLQQVPQAPGLELPGCQQ